MEELQKTIKALTQIPTASLSDALDQMGLRGYMSHEIRPILQNVKVVGPAVTIKHRIVNKRMPFTPALKAIDEAKPGDVLVISSDDDLRDVALLGGLMGLAAKVKGLSGAVLGGGVRDVRELRELGFQVFSLSVIPTTSLGRTEIEGVNVPLRCGGLIVKPGDLIVGDDDGVVVIPRDKVQEAIERARKFDEVERMEAEELRKGTPLVETVAKFARI
jgi:regulator of RNase E activity RraA